MDLLKRKSDYVFLCSKPNCLLFHSEYMPKFFLTPTRPCMICSSWSLPVPYCLTPIFCPFHAVQPHWNSHFFPPHYKHFKHPSVLDVDSNWSAFPSNTLMACLLLAPSFFFCPPSIFCLKVTFLARSFLVIPITSFPTAHQNLISLL